MPFNFKAIINPKITENLDKIINIGLFHSHNKYGVINILTNDLLGIPLRKGNTFNMANPHHILDIVLPL